MSWEKNVEEEKRNKKQKIVMINKRMNLMEIKK